MWLTVQKLSYLLTRRDRRNAYVLLALMLGGALIEVVGMGAIPGFVTLLSNPTRVMRVRLAARTFELLGATTMSQRVLWAALGLVLIYCVKNAYLAAFTHAQAR